MDFIVLIDLCVSPLATPLKLGLYIEPILIMVSSYSILILLSSNRIYTLNES